MFEVTTLPSTFVKIFVFDYIEEVNVVNAYAEENRLEIKSITVDYLDINDFFYATVLFERGCL